MENSGLASLSWKWQIKIWEKVSKKQAKVLIWGRPKVERCLHLCVRVWSRRFVSDLHTAGVRCEFVNEITEALWSKEQRTESRSWWHLHRHPEVSTAFRKKISPLTLSLHWVHVKTTEKKSGLWGMPLSQTFQGTGGTGAWRHWVELVGDATRGPGSGTQQTLMLNRKESGCAEEAYRARDGCVSLALF